MSKNYRIVGESVTDAVGEEFGRLIAERDNLQQQVSGANPLAGATVVRFDPARERVEWTEYSDRIEVRVVSL